MRRVIMTVAVLVVALAGFSATASACDHAKASAQAASTGVVPAAMTTQADGTVVTADNAEQPQAGMAGKSCPHAKDAKMAAGDKACCHKGDAAAADGKTCPHAKDAKMAAGDKACCHKGDAAAADGKTCPHAKDAKMAAGDKACCHKGEKAADGKTCPHAHAENAVAKTSCGMHHEAKEAPVAGTGASTP